MFVRFTRWIDRQFVAADYRSNRTWVSFVCLMPFMIALAVMDAAGGASGVVLAIGLLISASAIGWAFWRWFKGFGSARRSERMVAQHRRQVIGSKHG